MKIDERTNQASDELRNAWAEMRFSAQSPAAAPQRVGGVRLAALVAVVAMVVLAVPVVLILARDGQTLGNGSEELPAELERGFQEFEDTYGISVDPVRRLLVDGDFTRDEYEPFANGVVDCIEASGLATAETYYQATEVDSGFGFRTSVFDDVNSDALDAVFDECERSSLFDPATSAWLIINYPTSVADRWIAILFLRSDHNEADARALGEGLAGIRGVGEWTYFSQYDALVEAREMFKDDERQLRIIEQEPSLIPASVRVSLVDQQVGESVVEFVENDRRWDIVTDSVVRESSFPGPRLRE